jgi:pimeloyl-ACP methyl ester carboxylesterase
VQRRTGHATVDGLKIAFQTYGEGQRHLIVVPGYMTNIDQNWEWPGYARFLERLGAFAQVILIDPRGTGLSDRIPPHSSFENTMDDVHAVMDEVGVERAALLGAGEGGPTCLLFAASFPERTNLLMLYEPFVARTWAPDVPWAVGLIDLGASPLVVAAVGVGLVIVGANRFDGYKAQILAGRAELGRQSAA